MVPPSLPERYSLTKCYLEYAQVPFEGEFTGWTNQGGGMKLGGDRMGDHCCWHWVAGHHVFHVMVKAKQC